MIFECVCSSCLQNLNFNEIETSEVEAVPVGEIWACDFCGEQVTGEYKGIETVRLSDSLAEQISKSIFACEVSGCGRSWDSEDKEYIGDITNYDVLSVFYDLTAGFRDSNDPYLKFMFELAERDRLTSVEIDGVQCGKCGNAMDFWTDAVQAKFVRRLIPEIPMLPPKVKALSIPSPGQRIEYFRSDCSPMLIHMTREGCLEVSTDNLAEEPAVEHLEPGAILWVILKTGLLKASRARGMQHASVCFTEKPLTALKDTLVGMEAGERRGRAIEWQPYGLMFERTYLQRVSRVEPVIAVSKEKRGSLPMDMRYREIVFDQKSNWLHEKEWRSDGDVEFDPAEAVVLVPNFEQAKLFDQALREAKIEVKAILPLYDLFACI